MCFAVGYVQSFPDCEFLGWNKEYSPVLAGPKVVTKVDEPVVDVALSVSLIVLPRCDCLRMYMMPGLGHGLPWSVRGRSLPLGRPFHQGPVCSAHSSLYVVPNFHSFPLPNIVLPRASNQYTQSARFAVITKLSACDDIFGALSTDGELFIFTPPESKPTGEKVVVKPQLVWALRKAFTAVKVSRGP